MYNHITCEVDEFQQFELSFEANYIDFKAKLTKVLHELN